MGGKCESVVLFTVLCLVCFCVGFFWLLIVLFSGEYGDVFLTEEFVERGLDKDLVNLTVCYKPVGNLLESTIG